MTASARIWIKAIKHAIEVLERERRRLHSVGRYAYHMGIRSCEISVISEFRVVPFLTMEITGIDGSFAEDGKAGYDKITEEIRQLQDLIEVLEDEPVIRTALIFPGME